MTIQTSLVAAEGALLAWKGDTPGIIIPSLAILIGIVAIVLMWAMTNIIIREHDHGHPYIKMAMRTEGDTPYLFRKEDPEVRGLKFSKLMRIIKWVLSLAWIGFLALFVAERLCFFSS